VEEKSKEQYKVVFRAEGGASGVVRGVNRLQGKKNRHCTIFGAFSQVIEMQELIWKSAAIIAISGSFSSCFF
jgi:hypothetical protein